MNICCYDVGSSNSVPCDNAEGWDGVGGGREAQRERTRVYLWPAHVDVWQEPTQYWKAIILQLKNK